MRKVLLAGALLALMTPSAKAADPAYETVGPASFSWQGLYAGVHVAFGTGQQTFPGDPDSTHRFNGLLGGVQFGFNHQLSNRVVIGLEATLGFGGLAGSTIADVAPPPFGIQRIGSRVDFLTTIGPRIGYAFDRSLIYAKGGFAAASFIGWFADDAGPPTQARNWRGGWFLGAGIEHAFAPNWTAKIEYNYVNLGNGRFFFAQGLSNPTRMDIHTVTIGVNYRFITGGGAVVARY
ncbi:outer membrane protein [Phreatobacter sp.]|uniref:outer membrane protein n=1 Tax=Phreatobacter sp. TaxID=1966341 RepID=UPI003F707F45